MPIYRTANTMMYDHETMKLQGYAIKISDLRIECDVLIADSFVGEVHMRYVYVYTFFLYKFQSAQICKVVLILPYAVQ